MKANKLFLLAMGLVAVGCNENQIEEQSFVNDAQGEAVEVVIDATVAQESRATSDVEYNESGNSSVVDLRFDVDDAIGVYFNNEKVGLTHENVKFTAVEKTEDGVRYTTTEPMILLGAGNNVYAYYPYKATDTGFEGSITRSSDLGAWDGYHYFNIPAVQEQAGINDYSNLATYAKLVSREQKLTKEGNKVKVNMVFEHAFSYISLNVQNETELDLDIKEAVIKLYNDGEPVALVGDLASGLGVAVEGEQVPSLVENGLTEVKVVPMDGADFVLASGEKTLITAAVAPVASFDEYEWVIRTKNGFSYKSGKQLAARELKQGINQQIGAVLSVETLSSEVTNSEFAEYLLHQNKEHIVLDVAADIELAIDRTSDDAWGGPDTKTITINGGADGLATNRTVSFNMSEQTWSDVDLKNTNATLYIKNLKLQTTGWDPTSKAGYSRTDLMFNCKVDLENVLSLSAIRAYRSFDANTLVVYDLKAGSSTNNYALWLAPTVEEQVVNINGFQTLNMTAKGERGIKIDAVTDYSTIDKSGLGAQKVTLTLDGKCFFNTTKKAAILVRTKVGAEVNIKGDVNIANVVDDQVNHVWIDEGAKTKEDVEKIVVKNARWKLEGATWSVENDANGNVVTAYADDNAGMAEAIDYGMNTIELADGAYTLPSINGRKMTISGSRAAEITVNTPNCSGSQLAFEGVTVIGQGYATGVQHVIVATYKDVAVKGEMCLYGNYVQFSDCDFDLGADQYIWVYGAKRADFYGCTFDTKGKAILIYNEVAGANKVVVKDCRFNSTGASHAGDLAAQSCAAIEISNFQTGGVGVAHDLTTENNSYAASFSGEWRIKKYVEGAAITVNGTEYTQIALDGRLMVENGGVIDFVE